MTDRPNLRRAEDVTPEILTLAEKVNDDYFHSTERVDWEEFIDRLADEMKYEETPWDFEEFDNPAIRKIQRHVRNYRRYE